MATYLITGIAGFIGSSLAHALVARGETVRGIDNFATGRRTNIEPILPQIDFQQVDLCDAAALDRATEGIDFIFHQGAIASVPRSVENPEYSHASNINGTLNLLQAARKQGVKRVVYAASSSAYGNQAGQPRVETMRPMPLSPYAVQKLTGEYYMASYCEVYGLGTISLRYFNIFGPRQDPSSPYSGVLARFILQMLRGERPTIFGDGEQARDFTYIANVVSANLLACDAPAEKVAGRVFNIGCGEQFTLNKTYQLLSELTGFHQPPNYGPPRAGDVMTSIADTSAAREAFGYIPSVKYEQGLAETVAWYRGQL
ncbi:MAG: NAD-dependent epimerase/dehydratase [Acidobacteriaceae bacterium]|nr:NAD-dependent epimerase/dehydratase [Acidobacteriaceae bacterium]